MPFCPNCGRSIRGGDSFCSQCGANLRAHIESEGVQYGNSESRPTRDMERECAYCRGSGLVDGPLGPANQIRCPVCKGRRYNLVPDDWKRCKDCGGRGEELYGGGITKSRRRCPMCGGIGWASE